MALITCPECGTQVSSLAAACPKCAAPIASAEAAKAVGQQVTTTELTSKKFKRQQLLAIALIIGGLILVFIGGVSVGGEGAGMGFPAAIGSLSFIAGLIVWLVARIRAWWHHG